MSENTCQLINNFLLSIFQIEILIKEQHQELCCSLFDLQTGLLNSFINHHFILHIAVLIVIKYL